MSKQMLSESEWSRNVGTQAFPVSFLHEYAVGLLWDKLHGRDPVVVTTMEGTESSDLRQGVDRVVIPDSMQPIGGCIPDLALLDKDLRPVRIIEVIVTSPPTDEKTEKLERLKERGVEVVLVPVRNEEELKTLVHERANGEGANWGPCIAAQGRQGRRVLIHPAGADPSAGSPAAAGPSVAAERWTPSIEHAEWRQSIGWRGWSSWASASPATAGGRKRASSCIWRPRWPT